MTNPLVSRLISRRRLVTGAVGVLLLVMALLLWPRPGAPGRASARAGGRSRAGAAVPPRRPIRARGIGTVEELRRRAVAALEKGDAAALCALAHPEERRDLNLNPDSVAGFLRENLWANGHPSCILCERFWEYSSAAIWAVRFSDAPRRQADFYLEMFREDSGWWLKLSSMLRGVCFRDRAVPAGQRLWGELAERHGITGILCPNGEYSPISAAIGRAGAARIAARLGEDWWPQRSLLPDGHYMNDYNPAKQPVGGGFTRRWDAPLTP